MSTGKRVAVVGSRSWTDEAMVARAIGLLPDDTIIVSGGARGVDTMARRAAEANGFVCVVFYPAWHRRHTHNFDKRAGFSRNALIVEYADEVFAFWDGKSSGTKSTIALAQKAGKPTLITYPTGSFRRTRGDSNG